MRRSIQVQCKEFSVAVDNQANSHSLIQDDQSVHICDIEKDADVQILEKDTSAVPSTGNEPITTVPPDEENNENEIKMEMKL